MIPGVEALEQAGWIAKLERLHRVTCELLRRKTTRPIEQIEWLPLQFCFLASMALIKQIRSGNQGIGKTWPALAEAIGRATGIHPLAHLPADVIAARPEGHPDAPTPGGPYVYPPPRPGWEGWIICSSWSQSVNIQEKLWHLLPKDLLDPRTRYDKANGFAPTKSPIVRFKNGSIIRIKTCGQDAIDFAGATIDLVLFDEPPRNLRMFIEALQRIQDHGGVFMLSYTPINADTEYLEELVNSGQIVDFHARLEPEQLIPVGRTVPLTTSAGVPKDEAWIRWRSEQVPEAERETVIHGEYQSRVDGAYFEDAWNPAKMVTATPPTGDHLMLLGVDFGHRPGKQIVHLIALQERPGEGGPAIYVLDEYVDEVGSAGPSEDADGIVAMLARSDMAWKDLDHARADRVHMPGSGFQKGIKDLTAALVRKLKLRELKPMIIRADKGKDSVKVGARFLHLAMRQGRFRVHPRCKRLLEALPRWDGRELDSQWKDPIDALRYALEPWAYRRTQRKGPEQAYRIR